MRRAGSLLLVLLALALAVAPAATAQTAAERLRTARTFLTTALEPDSAVRVLSPVFQSGTPEERAQALLLYGAALVMRDGQTAQARRAFETALGIQRALTIDDELEANAAGARELLGQVRNALFPPAAAVAPTPAAAVPVAAPILALQAEPVEDSGTTGSARLLVRLEASHDARAYVTLADANGRTVWSDSVRVAPADSVVWALLDLEGRPVPTGPYQLYALARDSMGVTSLRVEHTIQIIRLPADTIADPGAPSLLPEAIRYPNRRASSALVGLLVAGAAVAVPSFLGSSMLRDGRAMSGTAFAVAGAAGLAGVVGFLAGYRVEAVPENATRNAEDMQRYRDALQQVREENARRRAAPPVVVWPVRGGP